MGEPITLTTSLAHLLNKPSRAKLTGYPKLCYAPSQHGGGIRLEDFGVTAATVVTAYAASPNEATIATTNGTTAEHVIDAVSYAVAVGYATPGELAPPDSDFALTVVDPGMDSSLAAWYTTNQARIANARFWLWTLAPVDFEDTGYPSLAIGHHDAPPLGAGIRIYKNPCTTPGGSLAGFTDVTLSQYAANDHQLGSAGGNLVFLDLNNDGSPDLAGTTGAAAGNVQPGSFLIDGKLVLQGNGINLAGDFNNYLAFIGDVDADGDVDAYSDAGSTVDMGITALSQLTRYQKIWNGSAYIQTDIARPIPANIPSAVEAAVITAINDDTMADNVNLRFYAYDLESRGLNDLIIATYYGYSSQLDKIWWLRNNGAGTYTDYGATWGLPATGCFMNITPAHLHAPRIHFVDQHLHTSIDATGAFHAFVAGGSAPGVYRFNGTTFTKANPATCDLQAILDATDYGGGKSDDYVASLYQTDLTNSGRVDLVYDTPRNGACWIFENDGLGVFTHHAGPTYPNNRFKHWSPQGLAIIDLDNDGLVDFMFGGSNGTGGGGGTIGSAARCARIYRNTTTTPGHYLKVKIRRPSGSNRFGVGATIGIYPVGSSTLLRRLPANYFGLPVHFGCGSRTALKVVTTWPDSSTSTIASTAVDQTITVTS